MKYDECERKFAQIHKTNKEEEMMRVGYMTNGFGPLVESGGNESL